MVIHIDTISVETKEITSARNQVENIIKNIPSINSMHDFRVVGKGDKKTLIFDIVVDAYKLENSKKRFLVTATTKIKSYKIVHLNII